MTKNLLLLLAVIFFGSFTLKAQKITEKSAVYLEIISNGDKSINFTIAFYPGTFEYDKENDRTTFTIRVVNSSTSDFKWQDYKVLLQMKDKKLIGNYTTVAETGPYACIYTVPNSERHEQVIAFDGKLVLSDIENVYLKYGDQYFHLLFMDGDL